ncbi:dethiobiotin synthase [Mycolicibacterium phlei]
MTTVIVTGTDTGVGKTVATAALACCARLAGVDVAVSKPVQTGFPDDDDLAEVGRLSGVGEEQLVGGWRYPEPLAPRAAAERSGRALPTRAELVASVPHGELTLVEGAGGLLVEIGAGTTLRDLAVELSAPVLVVVSAGLGTLNHTALTLEALVSKGLSCVGLVIGAWPPEPGVVELGNRRALEGLAPVRAVLPAGAGSLSPSEFEATCAAAFDADWVKSLV